MKKHYYEITVDLSKGRDYEEIPVKGRSMYVSYCDGVAYLALQNDVSDIIRLYKGMIIDFAALSVDKIYIINTAQSNRVLKLGFFDRGGFLVSPDKALNYNFQQKSVVDSRAFAVSNLTTVANAASYSVYLGANIDLTISHFSVTASGDVATTVYKDPSYSGGSDLTGVCLNFINGNDTVNVLKTGVTLSGGTPVMSFVKNIDYTDGIFIPKGHSIGIHVQNDLGSSVSYAFFLAYTL